MNILTAIVAFISEYLDSGLGMGYGTALAPVLILIGYSPLTVIPAILLSQLVTDIAACFTHHRLGNVDLKINSFDFKAALLLGAVSSIGVTIAVIVALKIPRWMLTFYIGLLVLAMGILIIVTQKKPVRFSWNKIIGLSFLASFNKGISAGGYGPLVMGGQILSGINPKNAVGITAFAEAITCFIGFIIYLIMGRSIDWKLTSLLIISAVPAVPVAALTVKYLPADKLRFYAGILIIILGVCTLLKIGSG
ncbi:MAG: sulfite exporter TauE/SafE family protein [Candidatus Omnitrophota bacterium]|nr:sulfite exporter TauE/SafE family protein [Candidatus Omnitrophota bacterium]MBU1929654.1 sulfite exporter TauE/SafE family protein [Candidatus Omnitrophota bacterium]MBU2035390.1 sulfite exporter TauE/SafE family protein [Candidatus Omnitrophota bacterium]MBU2258553.1 sulfite exporter TauE/SafE family protein [Candidatus Omnitrophota bacterium]